METDAKALEASAKLQEITRKLLMSRYGRCTTLSFANEYACLELISNFLLVYVFTDSQQRVASRARRRE